MASEVTICNLALSHLGDTANVTSIRPPDHSVQAQLCAQFYPVARNVLLEMAAWGFATRRIKLALLENNPASTWAYAYAAPSAVVNALAVLHADAVDDYEATLDPREDRWPEWPQGYRPVPGAIDYSPKPYALETAADGSQIVLTNVADAVFRYTTIVEDTTKFSSLFVLALSYLLASMLAGPLIKGDTGAKAGAQMLALFGTFEGKAEASDANQRRTQLKPAVGWIRGR